LIVMGSSYAYLSINNSKDGLGISYTICDQADKSSAENTQQIKNINNSTVYFRVEIDSNATCQFSYSTNGNKFLEIVKSFKAQPGRWIGAKVGIFCTGITKINDSGFADFDWFRVSPFSE